MTTAAEEFRQALAGRASRYGVELDERTVGRLCDYFEHVRRWNARLHLVAPAPPAEFATRHVLESLLALGFLPEGAHFIDVGPGAGLPALPCLIARADLSATLVEASRKKAIFLREALSGAGLAGRATVLNKRFEELVAPAADALTCRALERFAETLPRLLHWSPRGSTLLLFGGTHIREQLERLNAPFRALHIPDSERRYLFVVARDQ